VILRRRLGAVPGPAALNLLAAFDQGGGEVIGISRRRNWHIDLTELFQEIGYRDLRRLSQPLKTEDPRSPPRF
jgi:hypothetical protein